MVEIPHRESELKSELKAVAPIIVPTFVILSHEDVRRSGYPDMTWTGYGHTSWLEVKHATPRFEKQELQYKTLLSLDVYGFCARYLVYFENGRVRKTMIIKPRHIDALIPEASCDGFDHGWVCEWIRNKHRQGR